MAGYQIVDLVVAGSIPAGRPSSCQPYTSYLVVKVRLVGRSDLIGVGTGRSTAYSA
jgi:hypothetical protein